MGERLLDFFVPGIPRATQTGTIEKRGNRLIPMRRQTGWTDAFYLEAKRHRLPQPLGGPLVIAFTFYIPRPKKPKRGCEDYPAVRPDADNYFKGLADSVNNTLWLDDAQGVDVILRKRWADYPYPDETPGSSAAGVLVRVERKEYPR